MKKWIIIAVLLLVAGGGTIYFFTSREELPDYETVNAEKTTLKQTVRETGKVEANQKLMLSFGMEGKLTSQPVEVGENVQATQTLAKIEHKDLLIQKQEKEASLKSAKAELQKIKKGAKTEEVRVVREQVNEAKERYKSAQKSLVETKKSAQNSIDQASERLHNLKSDSPSNVTSYEQAVTSALNTLKNTKENYNQVIEKNQELALSTVFHSNSVANTALDEIDSIINNKELENLSVLGVKNTATLNKTEKYYTESVDLLQKSRNSYDKASGSDNKNMIKVALDNSISTLSSTLNALDYCYKTLENSITSTNFTSSDLNSHKTTIDGQITGVNSNLNSLQNVKHNLQSAYISYDLNVTSAENNLAKAKTNLDDAIREAEDKLETAKVNGEQQITEAKNSVKSAQKALEVAKRKLEQIESPARSEDVQLAEAEVERARASINLLNDQIDKSIIKAPIDGKIMALNYEIGEQVPPNSTAIELLNKSGHKIEVNISEVDIAKIKEGDDVTITFDAFDESDVYTGIVAKIDPAETIIQDVVYYTVTIHFKGNGEKRKKIKPGMTANVVISTDSKSNVIAIPSRAIIKKSDDETIVRIFEDGEIKEKPVEVGLRGDNGMTEIKNGVEEGEEVVTYVE